MANQLDSTKHAWTITLFLCLSSLIGAGTAALAQGTGSESGQSRAPTVEAILRRTADFYMNARSLSVKAECTQKLGLLPIQMTSTIAFQRPNRFARRCKGFGFGFDAVSDGKKLYRSVSTIYLQKYTEAEVPASLETLVNDPIVGLEGRLILELCSADPCKELMAGMKPAYVGLETLDGVKAHHLKFTQDDDNRELWVAADGDPLIRRLVSAQSLAVPGSRLAELFNMQKLEFTLTFKAWQINQAFDEKTFAFQPPKGAEKVESLTEALGGKRQEPVSPLLAKPAPDVSLKLLDEGEFRLTDHHNKDLVMLDFWATWCGPCVMELPLLAQVASAYKDKGVVFCAVNLQEKPDQIRKFLEEKKLAIPVALDSEGKAGSAYRAEAIPTLVLIDKNGVLQSVHVGYNPSIKEVLGKELDALLAGKDLAKEARQEAKEAQKNEGLELVWAASEPYLGLAVDPKGKTIYALRKAGHFDVLDPAGKTMRTFQIGARDHGITRFARFAGGMDGLVSFRTWGNSVLACKTDGTKLWEEPGGLGVDDVWVVDLDGDGVDEVIVGYNGFTGLHVFSADGKRLWKRTDLGNVWHVTAADVDGDGKPEVVSTSAQGKVHISSPSDGKAKQTLEAGLYANMIRTAPGRVAGGAKGDILLVVGTRQGSGETMAALGGDGKVHWTVKFPSDSQHCDSMAVSPDGTWAGVGLRGGRVCVVDLARGRIIAQVSGQGMTPMVDWATPANAKSPLLLVATGSDVNAFRVKPVAAGPEDKKP